MSDMPLNAARKRIYWIVRNKTELLRDTGQTKDADFDNEAWELISAQLEENQALRERLAEAEKVIEPFSGFADAIKDMGAGGKITWAELPENTPFYGLNGDAVILTIGHLRAATKWKEE